MEITTNLIMKKGISVILCCYNSATRLHATLKHIAMQEVPVDIKWEVIIVNNASHDNTKEVANMEWNKYNSIIPFKIVDQPIAGLTAARSKGVAVSNFEYLLFCDDDNWLSADYIKTSFQTMESHLDVGILGGQSQGFFESTKPWWFNEFSAAYAIEKPFETSRYLPLEREYLAGAGMVIRRGVFEMMEQVNFLPILTDRNGGNLMSGGDYELCMITRFLGFELYYEEKLNFVHFMPKGRLHWDYFIEMKTIGQAIPEIYFDIYRKIYYSSKNQESTFTNWYRCMLLESIISFFFPNGINKKHVFNSLLNFKYLIWSYPGMKNEYKIRAAKNKMIFLLKNRKIISKQHHEIKNLIIRIVNLKSQ